MPKLLLLVLLLIPASLLYSQNCIPSVIIFTTQAQVDGFPSNHPGCTIIDGNLGITGNDITNLDSLSQLNHIDGSVQISAGSLSSIEGLSNVIKIGEIGRAHV